MSNKGNQRSVRFWVSAWLPVALAVVVIILESSAFFGANRTSRPLRIIFQAIFGPVSDARWGTIHFYIRKSGHFLGYGAVCLTWLRAWWMTLPRLSFFQDALLALFGTGLLAAWDEWHQSFLANRTSSPRDVLLDCCGAIAVCLLTYGLARLLRLRWLQRAA